MLSKNDREYMQTKAIKLGLEKPDVPKALFDWCGSNWPEVHVLNIIYDAPEKKTETKPWFKRAQKEYLRSERLQVIFERESAFEKLEIPDINQQSSLAYKDILAAFKLILKNYSKYETNNMFVNFSSFEKIAKEDAVSSLSKPEVSKIGTRVFGSNYWDNLILFGSVVFFLETEKQKRQAIESGLRENCADLLSKLLLTHDTFGYFKQSPLIPYIDSKENFDKNYNSSWFNYTR